MKRSEMLNKIQDALINLGLVTQMECSCCYDDPTLDHARIILDILENEGMLPPEYDRVCESEFQYNSYKLNRWEPEDE